MSALPPPLTLDLPPEPSSAQVARDALARLWPDHPRIDDALLCVSEVVTNAVLHARTAAVLTMTQAGDALRVEVHDRAEALPVRRHQNLLAAGGRGLLLLDHLADRWGVEVVGNAEGKLVWFEIGSADPAS